LNCLNGMQPNLKRMLELVDAVFETRNDPSQIGFSEEDMAKMNTLHPECLQESCNEAGPIAWISIIPTSRALMNQFTEASISERELFDRTSESTPKEAVYLCSAIVLPEHRRQGVAFNLSVAAIQAMQKDFSITDAFVWPFSDDGQSLAIAIARACELELKIRADN